MLLLSPTLIWGQTFTGTVADIRAISGTSYKTVFTTDYGSGTWYFDSSDVTSTDNTGTILVTCQGKRYKRQFSGKVYSSWFGAIGDSTERTTQLKEFIDYCINNEVGGEITPGNYIISEGVLVFDNGGNDKFFPDIATQGYDVTLFTAANISDAPLITISNGVATSGSGKFWQGGSWGGITFIDSKVSGRENAHAFSLRGIKAMKFGHMKGQSLNGSVVYFPFTVYGGTNPDPYSVWFSEFEVVEANGCKGYGIENQNFLGFNSNIVNNLRVVNCLKGGWYGFGSANIVNNVSMGSCSGWAFDDGTNLNATGGAPLKFTVNNAELDDVQYGIRLNRTRQFQFNNIRFNHRYNFSSLNPSEGYWPRVCVDMSAGLLPSTSDGQMNINHRIEAGGAKADMGSFVEGNNNPNISNVVIDNRVIDNAGFGFSLSDIVHNVNGNSNFKVIMNSSVAYDSEIKFGCIVTATTSQTIGTSSISTAAAKIIFPTERYDRANNYNPSTGEYTVPYTGLYRVSASIQTKLPVGTRVKLSFLRSRAGIPGFVQSSVSYAVSDTSQSYSTEGTVDLVAGDKVFLSGEQNSGAAANLVATTALQADNKWTIEPIIAK